jgi:hypothetical protein
MSSQTHPFTSEHTMVPNGTFKIMPLSKKFMSVFTYVVSQRIKELKITHPDWTLVEVVAFILSDTNKKLTAPMVLELVAHIASEWEKTTEEVAEPMLLEAV